ncbi:MAG: MBL fold metallo-hydrolase [Candidatus Hodarchaeales archaeon]|jgi:glyoxylase-like metal-dependent hydrolase (beta-lactamase superfamily II)
MSNKKLEYHEVSPTVIQASLNITEKNKLFRSYENVNMCCIANDESLSFFDCGGVPSVAKKFREDMEEKFGLKTTHLFLSHSHWDHTFGMKAFKDVDIVASNDCRTYIRGNIKKGTDQRYAERIIQAFVDDEELMNEMKDLEIYVPTIGVKKNETFFGTQSFPLEFSVEGYHSRPSSVLYSQNERILFSGDIFQVARVQTTYPISIVDLYKKWEEKVEFIIPGHGPTISKTYLIEIRKYLENLIERITQLKTEGLELKEVLNNKSLPDHPGMNRISWIEGSHYHTKTLHRLIRWFYNQVERETHDSDLMFISF